MWSSRRSRWISGLLCLALFTSCPKTYPPMGTPKFDVCTSGNTSKGKPMICVDDFGNPDPKKKGAWDENKEKESVHVTWQARTEDADLIVRFDDLTCVEKQPDCKPNKGECTVKLKKQKWTGASGEHVDCRYKTTIKVNGHTHDPYGEMIVNPCCW